MRFFLFTNKFSIIREMDMLSIVWDFLLLLLFKVILMSVWRVNKIVYGGMIWDLFVIHFKSANTHNNISARILWCAKGDVSDRKLLFLLIISSRHVDRRVDKMCVCKIIKKCKNLCHDVYDVFLVDFKKALWMGFFFTCQTNSLISI